MEEHHGNRSFKSKAIASRKKGETVDIADRAEGTKLILREVKVLVWMMGIMLGLINVPEK